MLRRCLGDGTELQDVKIPGRKREGIRRQAVKLGLAPPLIAPRMTAQQKAKLVELRRQGVSPKKILDLDLLGHPRRTLNSIYKVCSRLGLVQENRSRAARKRKIWREGEKEEFIDFLLQRSKTLAPEQIAKIFGVSRVTVEDHQRQLKVKLCFAETMALPHTKEKLQKSRQRRSRKMLDEFERGLPKKQKKLKDLAEAIRTRNRKRALPLEEKQCASCGYFWPKHRKFFHFSSVRANGFTNWHFFAHCKICTGKQRHAKNALKHQKKYQAKKQAV